MLNYIVITLGVVLGLVTGFLVWEREVGAQKAQQGVAYMALKLGHSIVAGEKISAEDIVELPIPQTVAENEQFKRFGIPYTATNLDWVDGRTVRADIPMGGLLSHAVFSGQEQTGFDALVGKGKRALTIPVSLANTIHYEIIPGSRIDVIGIFKSKIGESSGKNAKSVLNNVEVIAVGRATNARAYAKTKDRGYRTLTLKVTAEQALTYALARSDAAGEVVVVLHGACPDGTHSECG